MELRKEAREPRRREARSTAQPAGRAAPGLPVLPTGPGPALPASVGRVRTRGNQAQPAGVSPEELWTPQATGAPAALPGRRPSRSPGLLCRHSFSRPLLRLHLRGGEQHLRTRWPEGTGSGHKSQLRSPSRLPAGLGPAWPERVAKGRGPTGRGRAGAGPDAPGPGRRLKAVLGPSARPVQSGLAWMLGPTSLGTSSFLSRGPAPKQDQVGYGLYCDWTLLASTSPPGHVTTSLHCLLTLN